VLNPPARHLTLSRVVYGLALAAIACSLALAVWAFVACARQQPPTRALFVGLGVVAAVVTAQVVIATGQLVSGRGPHGADRIVTFVGYLLTVLLLPPAGAVLARMEPTRWGSGLIGAAAIVVPVLILRMQQVWSG
jgi:hypothetical protein